MSEYNLPEMKGIAFTTLYHEDGGQINITERSEISGAQAAARLVETIKEMKGYGYHPTRVARTTDEPIHPDDIDDVEPEATGEFARDWGLVDYMPKAAELSPNDELRILVNEYEYKPDSEVRFFKEGDQYPQVTHNMSAEYPRQQFEEIFKGWKPQENERLPIPKGSVILNIKCSQNLTKAGNPYRNLVGISRG